jgi:hypothetical protein
MENKRMDGSSLKEQTKSQAIEKIIIIGFYKQADFKFLSFQL